MARREIGTRWDRENRNNINENFKELYNVQNRAIDNANAALRNSEDAVATANQAKSTADNVQAQFNQVVIEGDSSVEAAQARVSYTGTTYTTLKERLDQEHYSVTEQLAQNTKDIILKRKSVILNSDFEVMPYIHSRSEVYEFSITTERQYKNFKSLKITATGYENSADENKDFAFILTESMLPNEKMRVSFWVYPTSSNKTMRIRLAYSGGVEVNLGEANKWNRVDTVIDLTGISQGANYLYFDLGSSYTIYLSDLVVSSDTNQTPIVAESIGQVNGRVSETPFMIQNSTGMIDNLIEVAQTYQEHIDQIIYGNDYTAFDNTVKQVNGKYQMDCSSFVSLILKGVTFENSRYNGNSENVGLPLFFHNINSYKYRYANNMARYAFEKGYAFYPNEDFSNIQAGDVLFFSWDNFEGIGDIPEEARSSSFMKIDHVAIFLNRKNEEMWNTLQQYPNSKSVYKEIDNNYMNQCVLVARFPFANVETKYPKSNLIVDGNVPKNSNGSIDIGYYRLSSPLVKGRYYTMFINGQVTTPDSYFTVLINNKIIYSDVGRILPYEGVTKFHFPYLLDDVSRDIKISIGAKDGTTSTRYGNVNWVSLYEGFLEEKKQYEQPINQATIHTFNLDPTLVNDLDENMTPYYKYAVDGNKIFLNLSLPFKTLRTGNLTLGTLPSNTVIFAQRIPVNLIGPNKEAINATLQINPSGSVVLINYDVNFQWYNMTANGCVFRE